MKLKDLSSKTAFLQRKCEFFQYIKKEDLMPPELVCAFDRINVKTLRELSDSLSYPVAHYENLEDFAVSSKYLELEFVSSVSGLIPEEKSSLQQLDLIFANFKSCREFHKMAAWKGPFGDFMVASAMQAAEAVFAAWLGELEQEEEEEEENAKKDETGEGVQADDGEVFTV